MGREPMVKGKSYLIKIGTAREKVEVEDIISVMDGANLDASPRKERIDHHDVAHCILRTRKAIAFDTFDQIAGTGRFVIVDGFEISGGGIVRKALDDNQLRIRDFVFQRNTKWEISSVDREQRASRYSQRPALILLTGSKDIDKKRIARALEAKLFAEGRTVYFLGIANILYGVDADIKKPGLDENPEHLRRLAEVANVMLDAGMILVVTATDLTQDDLQIITAAVDVETVFVVWLGGESTSIPCNLVIPERAAEWDDQAILEVVQEVKVMLQNQGVIFRP
jgi:bifunctional enzyme CysN/CysC